MKENGRFMKKIFLVLSLISFNLKAQEFHNKPFLQERRISEEEIKRRQINSQRFATTRQNEKKKTDSLAKEKVDAAKAEIARHKQEMKNILGDDYRNFSDADF